MVALVEAGVKMAKEAAAASIADRAWAAARPVDGHVNGQAVQTLFAPTMHCARV
jgi:hypothetical protein